MYVCIEMDGIANPFSIPGVTVSVVPARQPTSNFISFRAYAAT